MCNMSAAQTFLCCDLHFHLTFDVQYVFTFQAEEDDAFRPNTLIPAIWTMPELAAASLEERLPWTTDDWQTVCSGLPDAWVQANKSAQSWLPLFKPPDLPPSPPEAVASPPLSDPAMVDAKGFVILPGACDRFDLLITSRFRGGLTPSAAAKPSPKQPNQQVFEIRFQWNTEHPLAHVVFPELYMAPADLGWITVPDLPPRFLQASKVRVWPTDGSDMAGDKGVWQHDSVKKDLAGLTMVVFDDLPPVVSKPPVTSTGQEEQSPTDMDTARQAMHATTNMLVQKMQHALRYCKSPTLSMVFIAHEFGHDLMPNVELALGKVVHDLNANLSAKQRSEKYCSQVARMRLLKDNPGLEAFEALQGAGKLERAGLIPEDVQVVLAFTAIVHPPPKPEHFEPFFSWTSSRKALYEIMSGESKPQIDRGEGVRINQGVWASSLTFPGFLAEVNEHRYDFMSVVVPEHPDGGLATAFYQHLVCGLTVDMDTVMYFGDHPDRMLAAIAHDAPLPHTLFDLRSPGQQIKCFPMGGRRLHLFSPEDANATKVCQAVGSGKFSTGQPQAREPKGPRKSATARVATAADEEAQTPAESDDSEAEAGEEDSETQSEAEEEAGEEEAVHEAGLFLSPAWELERQNNLDEEGGPVPMNAILKILDIPALTAPESDDHLPPARPAAKSRLSMPVSPGAGPSGSARSAGPAQSPQIASPPPSSSLRSPAPASTPGVSTRRGAGSRLAALQEAILQEAASAEQAAAAAGPRESGSDKEEAAEPHQWAHARKAKHPHRLRSGKP